jgi:hypothetical protein
LQNALDEQKAWDDVSLTMDGGGAGTATQFCSFTYTARARDGSVYGTLIPVTDRKFPCTVLMAATKGELYIDSNDKFAIRNTNEILMTVTTGSHPRKLSDPAKRTLKESLSKYSGQKFQIIQVGFDDEEARNFAGEIEAALQDCCWVASGGGTGWSNEPRTYQIRSGVTVFCNTKDQFKMHVSNKPWPVYADLLKTLDDCKIERASKATYGSEAYRIPEGTLQIVVGPQPKC